MRTMCSTQYSKMRWFAVTLLTLAAASILILVLTGILTQWWLIQAVSPGFVIAAILAGGFHSRYGCLIVAGLTLCWSGDYWGPRVFLIGVLSFLAGHLCFIAGFCLWDRHKRQMLCASIPFTLVSLAAIAHFFPSVPSVERYYTLPYFIILTAMAITSFGGPLRGITLLLPLAGTFFYFSDLFVAQWRFISQAHLNGICCYALYYSACYLFALSAGLYPVPHISSAKDTK